MSIFLRLVGLELKRGVAVGQLSSWSRRIIPGAAAAGGIALPALIYISGFAPHFGQQIRRWAQPLPLKRMLALAGRNLILLREPRYHGLSRVFIAAQSGRDVQPKRNRSNLGRRVANMRLRLRAGSRIEPDGRGRNFDLFAFDRATMNQKSSLLN
jgi:hypothetical protein